MNALPRTAAVRCPLFRQPLLTCLIALALLGSLLPVSPVLADDNVECRPGPDGLQVCITVPGTGGNSGGSQHPPGGGSPPPASGGQPAAGGGASPPASNGSTIPVVMGGGPGFGFGPPAGACAVAAVMGQPCAVPAPPVADNPAAPALPAPVPLIEADPLAEAVRLCASIVLPTAQLKVNPNLGLVNVPSWFWVEGYQGQDLTASESLPSPPYVPMTIAVRAYPQRFIWHFGDSDQTLITSSLGQAYPAESDVAHTYAFSSLSYPEGFPITLTIEWATEYRVNGGPPQPLAIILTRDYLAAHRVQEVQPLITNP